MWIGKQLTDVSEELVPLIFTVYAVQEEIFYH